MKIDRPLTCPRCARELVYDSSDLRRSTRHRGAYECPCRNCGERFVCTVEERDGYWLVRQWAMKFERNGRSHYAPPAEAVDWRR